MQIAQGSPDVTLIETDVSQQVGNNGATVGATVGVGLRGHIDRVMNFGNPSLWLAVMGDPDPTVDLGHYAALAHLAAAPLKYVRTHHQAKYAGCTLSYFEGVAASASFNFNSQNGAAVAGQYLTINSLLGSYYIWFNTGSSVDPAPVGLKGIMVNVLTGDTDTQVAVKFNAVIDATADFTSTISTKTVTVVNVADGVEVSPTVGTTLLGVAINAAGVNDVTALTPFVTGKNPSALNPQQIEFSLGDPDYLTNLVPSIAPVALGWFYQIWPTTDPVRVGISNVNGPLALNNPNTFTINFYSGSAVVPTESWTVSRAPQMDGMGLSQYIQDVINNQSTLMRYMDNMSVPSVFMPTIPSSTANNVFLAGGDPGLFPPSLSAALRDSVILGLDPYLGNYPVTKNSGWQMFASTETQTIDLMIEAGYTDVSVQIALDQICAARQDCEVIHDVPYSSLGTRIDNTTATVEARQATGINSNRSSMFAPWGVIDDPYNGIANLEVPISGYISASMAACDLANGLGFAAAGLINGQLPLKAVTNNYLKADRDILSAAQINAIRTLNGQLSGIYTWDCLTMQQQQSALSFLPVRRLASALERQIVEYLMYAEFLPNNPRYRSKAANAVTQYLQPFMTSEALSDFSVVCNNTNNTSTSPQGQMTLQAFFTPTLPARQILFQAIICNASQQYATVFV